MSSLKFLLVESFFSFLFFFFTNVMNLNNFEVYSNMVCEELS